MTLPETRFAKTEDGLNIAYQRFGSGPDLVFVHRFVMTIGYIWDLPPSARFFGRLAEFCRVLAFDPRGTGLSDRRLREPDLSLERRMSDLAAVLDAEGLEHASLLGSEDGGSLSALFAATHPERVDRLVLHATFACGTARDDFPWMWTVDEWNAQIDETLRRWDDPEWLYEQGRGIAPAALADTDSLYRAVNLYRFGADPMTAATMFRIQRDLDIRSILPSIQAPTLILHPGAAPEDVFGPLEISRYLAERIPTARLVEVPGADFEIYSGNSDGVLEEIEEFVHGTRGARVDSHRALTTVLFTDIVGSTAKAASVGDARWKDLLAEHDARAREQLARFAGREIDRAGDGFFATFDGPARAVRCAFAIGDAVRPLGVEIRAGCHTGEVEYVGQQVRGIAVHIGARVTAMAGPTEVWTSSTVKDLTAGSGLAFIEGGEYELKGVPDRWHLYRVDRASSPEGGNR